MKVGDLETCMKDLDGMLPEGWRERVKGVKGVVKEEAHELKEHIIKRQKERQNPDGDTDV